MGWIREKRGSAERWVEQRIVCNALLIINTFEQIAVSCSQLARSTEKLVRRSMRRWQMNLKIFGKVQCHRSERVERLLLLQHKHQRDCYGLEEVLYLLLSVLLLYSFSASSACEKVMYEGISHGLALRNSSWERLRVRWAELNDQIC